MKNFYKSLLKVNNTPAHLGVTFILSFFVMLFINIFIGSLGGIPAMVSFFTVYYVFRGMVLSGRRTEGEILLESTNQIKYILLNYCAIYMIIWAMMRMVLILSKMTGWGNIRQLNLTQYMERLYGTTMMERWAYIFAGILMASYIVSLFPILVIRQKKKYMAYLLIDSFCYATICFVIAMVCRIFIDNDLEGDAFCVLDDMLLCRPKELWQTAMYIVLIIILLLVQFVLVYRYSIKEFSGNKDESWKDDYRVWLEKLSKKRILITLIAFMISALIGGVIVFFFAPSYETVEYDKVAECLTQDSILGPMQYGGEVYIPVDLNLDYYEKGTPLGYIGYKEQNCDSRFYRLAVANILYDSNGGNQNMLQMYGADCNSYCRASLVEKFKSWEEDDTFLLWDEEWSKESAYANDITGYTECNKEFVLSLEQKYGKVEYNPRDFYECDAYFTICGYDSIRAVEECDKPYGDWVGCILVKDNIFYYGNFDNPINGVQLSALLNLLSGK